MPSKKESKSSKSDNSPKRVNKKATSGNLELTRAINKIVKTQDDFMSSVKLLSNYTNETLSDLNLQIEARKTQIANLGEEYDNSIKEHDIQIKHYYAEHKYNGAVSFLRERKEEPISSSVLVELRNEIENLRKNREKEINDIIEKEKKSHEKSLRFSQQSLELKHKAEIAELNACVRQQKNDVATLNSTILNLKEEVSAQRELTKDVAMASKGGAISQSFGKQ